MALFNHGHGEESHDRTGPESATPGAEERLVHRMNLGFLLNDDEPATATTHPPPATYSPMSQPQSQSQSQSHGKGPRAHMACVACRKRHIKCEATSNPRDNTCARCVRKGLICEYMDVAVGAVMRPPASRRRPAIPGPTAPVHLVHPYAAYDAATGYQPGPNPSSSRSKTPHPTSHGQTSYVEGYYGQQGAGASQAYPTGYATSSAQPYYQGAAPNEYSAGYGGYGHYPEQRPAQPYTAVSLRRTGPGKDGLTEEAPVLFPMAMSPPCVFDFESVLESIYSYYSLDA
ncbi:hypothetical protein C8F01DRAFT_1093363 [Mycena amicta]|nr:hypothetical protein C8F01DRAFT_1093363 [Mycena amicta]